MQLETALREFNDAGTVSVRESEDIYFVSGSMKMADKSFRIELEIDGKKGFNVTKVRRYNDTSGDKPSEVISVDYVDGGTNGDVFFPVRYDLKTDGGGVETKLLVEFDDVKLNLPVDEKLYSFETMNVPKGTRLYDMHFGDPIQLSYGAMPHAALDKLVDSIVAQGIAGVGHGTANGGASNPTDSAEPSIGLGPLKEQERSLGHVQRLQWVAASAGLIGLVGLCIMWIRRRSSQLRS